MADKKPEQKETTPKGLEVPVPKRREFFDNLKKIAKPKPKGKDPDPAARNRSS